jgi:hypothetical protein
MNAHSFDALTRRASLAVLSAAGLTTLTAPFVATAKKNKNRRKNKNDKAKKKCRAQIDQCADLVALRCTLDPDECTEAIECCELLGNCDFAGYLNCSILVGE